MADNVGTPWQEFIKSVPVLTTGFAQVWNAVEGGGAVDGVVGTPQPQPQPQPQPAQPPGGLLSSPIVLYGGLALGGLLAVVLVSKALD